MKVVFFFVFICSAYAVVQDFKIGIRLIPADVLRDFRTGCFASTQCKVFQPNETWSLLPHCGYSRCVNQTDTGRLLEEVVDCGPVINIKAFPNCQLVPDSFNKSDVFPNCCPKYECEGDDTSVIYPDSKPKTEAPVVKTEAPVQLVEYAQDYAQYEDIGNAQYEDIELETALYQDQANIQNQDIEAQYQDPENSQYQDIETAEYQDSANVQNQDIESQYQDPTNVQNQDIETAQYQDTETAQYQDTESVEYEDIETAQNQDLANVQNQDIEAQYQDPETAQYQDTESVEYEDAKNVEYEDAQGGQVEEAQYVEDSA